MRQADAQGEGYQWPWACDHDPSGWILLGFYLRHLVLTMNKMTFIKCPVCGYKASVLAEACLDCGNHLRKDEISTLEKVVIAATISTLIYTIAFMTSDPNT